MVSSVQQSYIVQNPFGVPKNDGRYYISAKTAKDIFVAAENDKNKKGERLGFIIVASSLAAALGVFVAVKGLPKNTYRWIQKWGQHLEDKVNKRKLAGKSGPVTSFYNSLFKNINTLTDKSRGLNNFGTIKDLMFTKLMYKNKYTKKIHNKITSLFERLAKRTVNKAYKKSDKQFTELFRTYSDTNKLILSVNPSREVTINGVTKKVSEWVDELGARQISIKNALNDGFGKSARNDRYIKMLDADNGLEERVWNVLVDKNDKKRADKLLTTFIAEDSLAADKMSIIRTTDSFRNKITHNITDNYNASKHALDNIASFLDPSDKISRELLKELRSGLLSYKKLSGPYEKQYREIANKEIVYNLKRLAGRLKETSDMFGYNKRAVNQVEAFVQEIENILCKSSKGGLQEVLSIYKGLLPYDRYVKLRNATNNAVNKFDKAIDVETDRFFDKLRDLKLGSGPTDVLSLLGSVGSVGLGLTLADNKEERTSALLKYGIPVIGGVATSIVMTVGLVSGVKSLIYGFLSSLLINRLGVEFDKHIKEYNKKQMDIQHNQVVKAEIVSKNV